MNEREYYQVFNDYEQLVKSTELALNGLVERLCRPNVAFPFVDVEKPNILSFFGYKIHLRQRAIVGLQGAEQKCGLMRLDFELEVPFSDKEFVRLHTVFIDSYGEFFRAAVVQEDCRMGNVSHRSEAGPVKEIRDKLVSSIVSLPLIDDTENINKP